MINGAAMRDRWRLAGNVVIFAAVLAATYYGWPFKYQAIVSLLLIGTAANIVAYITGFARETKALAAIHATTFLLGKLSAIALIALAEVFVFTETDILSKVVSRPPENIVVGVVPLLAMGLIAVYPLLWAYLLIVLVREDAFGRGARPEVAPA